MHNTARTTLLVLLAGMLIFGICMLYSTSFAAHGEFFLKRQLLWVGLGLGGAAVLYALDYRTLGRYSPALLIAVGLALAYLAAAYILYKLPWIPEPLFAKLPFVPDHPTKGSFRWLRWGPLSIQPSEFAKPILILFLADYYSRRVRHTQQFVRGFLHPALASGVILALIFAGKDLSTTVITGTLVVVIMFVAGVRLRYLAIIGLLGVLFVAVVLQVSPERLRRFAVYRNPEQYEQTEGYQLWHSQLALGSGGLTGLGFTNSRMKQFYLPESHTDFIVAIVGEELGFLWIAVLLLGYCALTSAFLWIACLAADRMGVIICIGIGMVIGLQAFINVSVVSGFCPTTGVTAPLLSYGGSSMLSTLFGTGIVLSVSRIGGQEAHMQQLQTRFGTRHGTKDGPSASLQKKNMPG